MVIIIGTNFLHKFIVNAEKSNIYANNFKGLGTQPGYVALGLFLVTDFRRIKVAQSGLLGSVCFLVLNPAIKRLGVFILKGRLSGRFKLHHFGGRNETHRNIPEPRGVMAKVDAEGAISMVYNFTCDEQVQLNSFNIGMKIPPAEHFFKFSRFDYRPPFSSY